MHSNLCQLPSPAICNLPLHLLFPNLISFLPLCPNERKKHPTRLSFEEKRNRVVDRERDRFDRDWTRVFRLHDLTPGPGRIPFGAR